MRNADFLSADTHGELRKEFPPATVRTEVPVTDASRKVRRVIKHREADIKIGWLFGVALNRHMNRLGLAENCVSYTGTNRIIPQNLQTIAVQTQSKERKVYESDWNCSPGG